MDDTAVDGEEFHRAPATCLACGAITAARIEPDGTIRPIGRTEVCDCPNPEIEVLGE